LEKCAGSEVCWECWGWSRHSSYNSCMTFASSWWQMGAWENGLWKWKLEWHRNMFAWEQSLHDSLVVTLDSARLSQSLELS
jgi:hypothetical protein